MSIETKDILESRILVNDLYEKMPGLRVILADLMIESRAYINSFYNNYHLDRKCL